MIEKCFDCRNDDLYNHSESRIMEPDLNNKIIVHKKSMDMPHNDNIKKDYGK